MDDAVLDKFLAKCEDRSATTDDLNQLIIESIPSSIRDRLQRRTRRSPQASHIDHDGDQRMAMPSFGKSLVPKRAPSHQQNHGRARAAHDASTATQRMKAATGFFKENEGSEVTESLVWSAPEGACLVAINLLKRGVLDEAWLTKFVELSRELDGEV